MQTISAFLGRASKELTFLGSDATTSFLRSGAASQPCVQLCFLRWNVFVCSRLETLNFSCGLFIILLQPLRWRCVDCVIHHERDVREEQHHTYMWREQAIIEWSRHVNSNCCLLPQCEALRTCRSGFPIATIRYFHVFSADHLPEHGQRAARAGEHHGRDWVLQLRHGPPPSVPRGLPLLAGG